MKFKAKLKISNIKKNKIFEKLRKAHNFMDSTPSSNSPSHLSDFRARKNLPETFRQLYNSEKSEENLGRSTYNKLFTQKSVLSNEETEENLDTKNSINKKPKLSKTVSSKYLFIYFFVFYLCEIET